MNPSITVDCNSLVWLLRLAQRKQTIDGKSISQIHSASLMPENHRLYCRSLVKDGVTSLINLSIPCTTQNSNGLGIAITDIDNMLGVLKYHGGVLNIINKGDKITIKSGSKQTTIAGNTDARSFPHTPETIGQWYTKSNNIVNKIDAENKTYTKNDGSVIEPLVLIEGLDSTTMYEAFRCDSMNGQKFNQYSFSYQDGKLSIGVGKELKGKTTTDIDVDACEADPINATYNGGLEYIFQNLNSDVSIAIWDFTEVNMGYPMLITLGDGDFIFQMSNIGE